MRTALLACGAVICCCLVLTWPGSASAKSPRLDRTERKVVRLVNRIRAGHGLHRLSTSATLARAASVHSTDMLLRCNYLTHFSCDGTPMASRIRRYTRARWVGENVAALSGRGVARRVVSMWMGSPGHRAVLLSPYGRRIGVGRQAGRLGSAGRMAVFTADLASRH